MKKLICKLFGHNPDETELLLEALKASALNKPQRKPVYCQRCGQDLTQNKG